MNNYGDKSIHSGGAAALGPGLGSPRPPTTEARGARGSGGWTRESRALGQAEALGQAARPATARAESRGPAHRFLINFFFFVNSKIIFINTIFIPFFLSSSILNPKNFYHFQSLQNARWR